MAVTKSSTHFAYLFVNDVFDVSETISCTGGMCMYAALCRRLTYICVYVCIAAMIIVLRSSIIKISIKKLQIDRYLLLLICFLHTSTIQLLDKPWSQVVVPSSLQFLLSICIAHRV